MNTKVVIKIRKALVITNIVFWLFIASYFSFFRFLTDSNYALIKVLLFSESLLYCIVWVGLYKKSRLIYLFSLIFTLGNSLLSITDEFGLFDLVSLVLSFLTFLSLCTAWRLIMKKSQQDVFI
jgi:hypothetical protein